MPYGLHTRAGLQRLAFILAGAITHGAFGRPPGPDALNPPNEDYEATALVDEIGRVPVSSIAWLIQDPAGTITFTRPDASTDGPYRLATTTEVADAAALVPPQAPSDFMLVEFELPANVATGEIVGQVGLLLNAATSVPGFAAPAQVTQAGTLFYVLNTPAGTVEPDATMTRQVALRV